MFIEVIAMAVLLAEIGLMIRYRIVRRRLERPSDYPQLTDFRYSHLAVALAAAAIGWAVTGARTDWGTVSSVLFIGTVVPAQAALAATTMWRPLAGWVVCIAGGAVAGVISL